MTNSDDTAPDASGESNPPGVVTLNRRGRTTWEVNEYAQAFVDFVSSGMSPGLDLGAAFGVATLPGLMGGARIIANDVEPRHLEILRDRVPREARDRLELVVGRFPDELEFQDESLGAILASNLFNFLRGDEIERGLHKAFRWLRPGGKLFTISGSPYVGNLRGFIPEYEARRRAGEQWPGTVEQPTRYSSHPTIHELPDFIHLLDDQVLVCAFHEAGFRVEKAEMFLRRNLPDYLYYDGRENTGVIGVRP